MQQEKSINLNVSRIIHSPTLSTVIMVEDALRSQDGPVSMEGLKRSLPKKVMDQSLRMILAYLENKGSIIVGPKGISWIANDNPKFLRMIGKAMVVEARKS
ncbi:MAG: hypothetical protein V1678_01105 [Candidatus Aenigmatarchaeota archaeon]